MSVPQTNPTKLLVDSNLHEYFDNNVHKFNFEWKRSARFVKNYLFGIEPVGELSSPSPYNRLPLDLTFSNYKLTTNKLEMYNKIVQLETKKLKTNGYDYQSWADKTLRMNETCLADDIISTNCTMSISVRNRNLIHQFPDDFAVIPGDGPFITDDLKSVGYFISIPTDEKLRIDALATEKLFREIEETCDEIKKQTNDTVMCTSSSEITRFYDIISQLKSSSIKSVSISIIVCLFVIIACTRVFKLSIFSSFVILSVILWTIATLIFFGWQLSVVESTILVITIGLSFDYTLHYVVAIRNIKFVPTIQKIRSTYNYKKYASEISFSEAHSTAGKACGLGSLTLLLAGFPLLLSHTASFFQIGSMLVVLGVISLFCASIILPAFVLTFSCDDSRKTTKL